MSEFNKSYRIRTDVGKDKALKVKLDQQYDILEIMSLKIDQKNLYKLHTSNYGVIAGRVLANGGFGIPNAKISVFIGIDNQDMNDIIKSIIYPYNQTSSKDKNNVRYNLLPNEQLNDCHTIIGTFPSKQLVLDNDILLEIFEKYYKFTTKTNESGDYMIFGVPTGVQTIHVDIDLSDVGILSQKPRDMIYKGYNINQFENPNKFKYDTNLNSLAQVISEDTVTEVIPFWGDEEEGTIGITRCDVNVNYKFEPTCVFMGSVVSDSPSNGFSTKCIPTPGMGAMDELTTGSGTIEMIRKTPSGDVEEVQIQGTQLINGDGIWCYQIPMNLDYMKTDEFGKMVPTDDPSKGIATRTRVRFRVSMQDGDNDTANIYRGKILVPNNPDGSIIDYEFGTSTKDESYRDLFWNCVYSVKSYIPRIQKGNKWKNEKFTGFKRVNYYNDNNPLPYNNIRIKIPFIYSILCIIMKLIIYVIKFINIILKFLYVVKNLGDRVNDAGYITLDGELCSEDLSNHCIMPGVDFPGVVDNGNGIKADVNRGLTIRGIILFYSEKYGKTEKDVTMTTTDDESIDKNNQQDNSNLVVYDLDKQTYQINNVSVTNNIDYFINCLEMNLALEYKVIQFDFYNDWINGVLYFPRWMRTVGKKYSILWGLVNWGGKIKACSTDYKPTKKINIVQQCGLTYNSDFEITNDNGCGNKLRCHSDDSVRLTYGIFKNNGLINIFETLKKQKVYYYKPKDGTNIKLYSTDIILLGNLNKHNIMGLPSEFKSIISSSYKMPPNLALTDSDIEGYSYQQQNKTPYIFGWLSNKKQLFGGTTEANGSYPTSAYYENNSLSGIYRFDDGDIRTIISGIDWGYQGPDQSSEGDLKGDLYKPGGNFLGLSCRNSETTIKTCVNLSRVCELGVDLPSLQEKTITKTDYYITPIGIISKDEISDNNFRRIFATLNSNKLKTKKNKNGYYVYDLKTINPTNFGGELSKQYNSFQYQKPKDDSVQIRRVGEFQDKEYIKFRFGQDTVKFLNNNSFPLYENSYYFYFGLHDGKTAIDEFKKQFYSVCTKDESVMDKDDKIYVTIEKIIYCDINKNNGSINIIISKGKYYENKIIGYKCYLSSKNDSDISLLDDGDEIINFNINDLSKGEYILKLFNDKNVEIYSTNFNMSEVTFDCDVSTQNAVIFTNDNDIDNTNTYSEKRNYIIINSTIVKHLNSDNDTENKMLSEFDTEIIYNRNSENKSIRIQYDNVKKIYKAVYGINEIKLNLINGELYIEVPYNNMNYNVIIKYGDIEIYHKDFKIKTPDKLDCLINDVSVNNLSYNINENNVYNWWKSINTLIMGGNIINNINKYYVRSVVYSNTSFNEVNIEPKEGTPPYNITCSIINISNNDIIFEDYDISNKLLLCDNNENKLYNIRITDITGQSIPDKSLYFPVYFKPFFVKCLLLKDIYGKNNLYVLIYNGLSIDDKYYISGVDNSFEIKDEYKLDSSFEYIEKDDNGNNSTITLPCRKEYQSFTDVNIDCDNFKELSVKGTLPHEIEYDDLYITTVGLNNMTSLDLYYTRYNKGESFNNIKNRCIIDLNGTLNNDSYRILYTNIMGNENTLTSVLNNMYTENQNSGDYFILYPKQKPEWNNITNINNNLYYGSIFSKTLLKNLEFNYDSTTKTLKCTNESLKNFTVYYSFDNSTVLLNSFNKNGVLSIDIKDEYITDNKITIDYIIKDIPVKYNAKTINIG